MEIKINSVIPIRNSLNSVQVFGYTSKGQPGLEIHGLNGKGRLIKEKIIFLSKKRKLRYPLKRFVLCVEGEELEKSQVEYLELPLLICFWTMANLIPLQRLDNCYASAQVSLDGKVRQLSLERDFWMDLEKDLKIKNQKVIYFGKLDGSTSKIEESHIQSLEIIDLLNDSVGGFS